MDTFDSPRSHVPARYTGQRANVPAQRFGGATNQPPPSPLSIKVALRGARRYWWLVLTLWAVGSAAIGAGIYLKVKPSYMATSLLRVSPSETDLYNIRGQNELLDHFLNTQVALITSPNVLSAAGVNPKAATLPRIVTTTDVVIELKKAIRVSIVPNTYLIEVAMNSPSAGEAAVLVNAVVEAFMDSNGEWAEGMTRAQIRNLEVYLNDLKNQSSQLEGRWKEVQRRQESGVVLKTIPLATANKPGDPAAKGNVGATTIEQYHLLQNNLLNANLDLSEKQAIAQSLRRQLDADRDNPAGDQDQAQIDIAVDRRLKADAEIRDVYNELMTAQAKLDEHMSKARIGNDPSITKARAKLRTITDTYTSMWDEKKALFREEQARGGPNTIDPEQDVREKEVEVERIKAKVAVLTGALANLKVESQKSATDSIEVTLINEQRESLTAMQNKVLTRLEQLRFEAKGEARIRQVNVAVPSGTAISDKRKMYLAMAPIGVLGVVLALSVLLEIRSARVGDTDALSSRVRQEVFAIAPLPNIRPGEDASDGRAEQRLARFVQSLDHLRVALCEGGTPGEGRCVMITSATGGEGKTTLSAHLAARCANAGTTTLLIDADMRRASLGRLLDVPAGAGLADVLVGDSELDSALVTVQAGGFHFLSAGTPGHDPSRVLKSSRLADLIGQLRGSYDLILIDTPPILPVADALIMGRWCDGAVMAARFDASRMPLVERANRQLAVAGIPVLGVVVNGVKGQDTTYGSYAYNYNSTHARGERSIDAPSA